MRLVCFGGPLDGEVIEWREHEMPPLDSDCYMRTVRADGDVACYRAVRQGNRWVWRWLATPDFPPGVRL